MSVEIIKHGVESLRDTTIIVNGVEFVSYRDGELSVANIVDTPKYFVAKLAEALKEV